MDAKMGQRPASRCQMLPTRQDNYRQGSSPQVFSTPIDQRCLGSAHRMREGSAGRRLRRKASGPTRPHAAEAGDL